MMDRTVIICLTLMLVVYPGSAVTGEGDDIPIDECPGKPCQQSTTVFSCIGAGCFALPDDNIHVDIEQMFLGKNNISSLNNLELDYRRLNILDLNTNSIANLMGQPFKNLWELQELDLGNNSITVIGSDVFSGLNELQTLKLNDNNISEVPDLSLDSLKNLDLTGNQLVSLKKGIFNKLAQLENLDLSGNLISKLDNHDFEKLTGLKDLELQGNNLSRIDSNTFYTFLKNLRSLNLNTNIISYVDPNAFSDLVSLEYLHLEDNVITHISTDFFLGLIHLKYLYLKNNHIENITKSAFYECVNLLMLDLSFNKIENIPPLAFYGLGNLKSLVLTGNDISNIVKGMFNDLPVLEELYLDRNPLIAIAAPSFPVSLKLISIGGTPTLTTIKNGTFTGLNNMETVTISNNILLREIEAGAFDQENSTTSNVDLSRNQLQTLSMATFDWTKVDKIDLSENPWDCDCHIQWIKASEDISATTKQTMKCKTPFQVSGKSVEEADSGYFYCGYYHEMRHQIATGLVCVITVVFILLCIFLTHRMRHQVLPCCFPGAARYKPLSIYNPVHSDDASVQINWNDKEDANAKDQLKPPKPVAV